MSPDEARRRFAAARVAYLATADRSARPHLVPLVFALRDETLYSVVDHKPKTTMALRRLANVAENPIVSLLVDHYEEEWSRLWWARADGVARVLQGDEPEAVAAVGLLAERYDAYRELAPSGPVLAVRVERFSGWDASEQATPRE